MGGASLTAEQAEAEIEEGWLDLVTWGRAFLANPDLAKRIDDHTAWVAFDDSMREHLI